MSAITFFNDFLANKRGDDHHITRMLSTALAQRGDDAAAELLGHEVRGLSRAERARLVSLANAEADLRDRRYALWRFAQLTSRYTDAEIATMALDATLRDLFAAM